MMVAPWPPPLLASGCCWRPPVFGRESESKGGDSEEGKGEKGECGIHC